MKHIKIKYLIFALATFQCASIFSSASLSTLMQQSTASLQAAQALFSSSFKPGTPPAPTPVATPMSTKFTNNSSQPLLIQALVNDVKNGDPVTIPYPGSGVVTVPATTGKVTYSITMPSSNPPYAASTAMYNPTAYPNGYTIGAHPSVGIVGDGITTPPVTPPAPVAAPVSATFYNNAGADMSVQALINAKPSGSSVTIPFNAATTLTDGSGVAVTVNALPKDVVTYSVSIPTIATGTNNPFVLMPNPTAYSYGYQVNSDGTNVIVGGITTPYPTAAQAAQAKADADAKAKAAQDAAAAKALADAKTNARNLAITDKWTIDTTPLSTTFTNNSSQPLLIQALVNGVNSGPGVTIPYPGSGVVTVPPTTGKVTYSITMPSSNPPYAASTATYNPTAYPNGYTIGAHPTLGLVGEGITTPNPYKTYSTIFYNTVDHWTWINPIVNDLKGAGVHIPPMGAMAVNITAFPSDKVMYSIFMDEIHGLNNNQVQLPPSNPSDSKNPIGYQVYVDKHDIKWNILTETPNLTAATSYNSRSLGRMSSKKATKKNKRSWAHKTL